MASKEEKALKKQQKAEAKAAKKAAKKGGNTGDMNFDEDEGGGGLLVALVTVVIIIIWLGIFALLIKLDVGGFGSSILYPVLKDVPYVNKILPTSTASGDASGEYGYDSLSDAVAEIKSLESQLDAANESNTALQDQIAELESEVSRLSVYEQEQAEFEQEKADFYEKVVFSDEAPDISEYQTYYESIDPDNAAELYKQVVQQEEVSQEVSDYAATYAAMKPANAASLLEAMSDNMDLVAEILENMSTDARAAILDAMDADFAAQVSALMAPSTE